MPGDKYMHYRFRMACFFDEAVNQMRIVYIGLEPLDGDLRENVFQPRLPPARVILPAFSPARQSSPDSGGKKPF
jgi:hypothetical protein